MQTGVETREHELRGGETGEVGDGVGPAVGAVGHLRPDGGGVDLGGVGGEDGAGDCDGKEG